MCMSYSETSLFDHVKIHDLFVQKITVGLSRLLVFSYLSQIKKIKEKKRKSTDFYELIQTIGFQRNNNKYYINISFEDFCS